MKKLFLSISLFLPFTMLAQWKKSTSLPTYSIYKLDFPALHSAYAIGDLGKLYKSTDVGVTWAEYYDFGPFSSLSDVRFFNADTGFVKAGWGQMMTFDGGITWASIGTFPKVKICQNLLYTSYVNNDIVYIQKSEDYGLSWAVLYQHYESGAQPFQLSFLNTDSAYFINPNELEQAYSLQMVSCPLIRLLSLLVT